jgi:hypothetical protein
MDQTLLELLKTELAPNQSLLGQALDTIRNEQISNYPLIILSVHPIELGISIFGSQKIGSYFYSASTLEELATKKIIQMDKVDDFLKVYKNHEDELCLFLIQATGGQFIFLPIAQEP